VTSKDQLELAIRAAKIAHTVLDLTNGNISKLMARAIVTSVVEQINSLTTKIQTIPGD